MKTNTLYTKVIAILLFIVSAPTQAQVGDYFKCNNREGGEWYYGRDPMVCDANSWGEDRFVFNNLDPVVFDDTVKRTDERNRYMNELNAVLREAAQYYIKKRNPSVSNEELNQWVFGILALASAETFWSHYRRTTDRRLKLMRGDFGHGHGLMQVDDRSHFPAINQGIGWNLIANLTYGMDIFYAAWVRAPSQSCVGSATNYTARIRSAWSAYNGGPGKICRWTNPNDPWAKNDQNFLQHMQNKGWLNHISDANLKSTINVICLIENKENCSSTGGGDKDPIEVMDARTFYRTAAGNICILHNNQANCVREERDRICLNALDKVASDTALPISDATLARYNPKVYDRHAICSQYDSTVIKVGTQLQFATTINLRATPGGGFLSQVPKETVLENLDFELRNPPSNDRYYKVKYNNITGYVYGGTMQTHAGWIVPAIDDNWPTAVARINKFIQIVMAAGINLRATPGGNLLIGVPSGTRLQVLDVVIKTAANEVYYKVNYAGRTGYIYSGVLLPTATVKSWTLAL